MGLRSLFGGKKIPAWSNKHGYKGGHRQGMPKKGSQYRKYTTRGGLFSSAGGRSSWWR